MHRKMGNLFMCFVTCTSTLVFTVVYGPVVCTHGNLNTHCNFPGYMGTADPLYSNLTGDEEGKGGGEGGWGPLFWGGGSPDRMSGQEGQGDPE